ncbi:MAG: insulinase family protein [Bacteroidia bacterium]|nr:insulinase family protein [Bacteroidia bacterium]
MRHKLLLFLLLFVLSVPSYSEERPQLDTFQVNTGLKIYFLKYGADSLLHIKLVIKGGKRNENKCEVGYSEIIRRLLDFELKTKYLAQAQNKQGFTCGMEGERTVLQGNCSITDFDRDLGILSASIVRLSFDKEKMDKIVSQLVDHNKPENISAYNLAHIYKNYILYGDERAAGRNYCQYQVEKVLPVNLREFYVRHYTPETASLIVCGNVDPEHMKKIISKHFVKWKSLRKIQNEEDRNLVPNIKGKDIAVVNKHQMDKYLLKWIFPTPVLKTKNSLALDVLCKLFDSYLLQLAEQKGLGNTNFRPLSFKGSYMEVNCYCEENEVVGAVQLMEDAVANFRKQTISPQVLQNAVKEIKELYTKIRSPKEILEWYDPLEYDFDSRKNERAELSDLTVLDFPEYPEEYFGEDSYKLIVIGKEHLVSGSLEKFGKVRRYQTSDFETCDETCKEIVIIKYHCESCRKRGFGYVWRFNPSEKEAIERARARKE